MSAGIEHLSKMAETVTETKAVPEMSNSDKSFNPDKRLDSSDKTDIGGIHGSNDLTSESFDPDKRIDSNQERRGDSIQDTSFNPDDRNREGVGSETQNDGEKDIKDVRDQARSDVSEGNISEVSKEYIDDLKSKSEVPDTIKDDALDVSKLEIVPSEEVARMREEFDDVKDDLRKEWEQVNNREWPRYETDVTNAEGKIIRKAGYRYDMHHIQPLKLGGKNEVGNITPLDIKNHNEVHSADGSCNKLVAKVAGGAA